MTGFAFAYAVVRVCGGQPRKNPGAPKIQFIYSYFVGKILGKEGHDDFERELYDLFNLAAYEKMNHLLDKYY